MTKIDFSQENHLFSPTFILNTASSSQKGPKNGLQDNMGKKYFDEKF